jgi:hypothetical protein
MNEVYAVVIEVNSESYWTDSLWSTPGAAENRIKASGKALAGRASVYPMVVDPPMTILPRGEHHYEVVHDNGLYPMFFDVDHDGVCFLRQEEVPDLNLRYENECVAGCITAKSEEHATERYEKWVDTEKAAGRIPETFEIKGVG